MGDRVLRGQVPPSPPEFPEAAELTMIPAELGVGTMASSVWPPVALARAWAASNYCACVRGWFGSART
jgi:hypothetical protein